MKFAPKTPAKFPRNRPIFPRIIFIPKNPAKFDFLFRDLLEALLTEKRLKGPCLCQAWEAWFVHAKLQKACFGNRLSSSTSPFYSPDQEMWHPLASSVTLVSWVHKETVKHLYTSHALHFYSVSFSLVNGSARAQSSDNPDELGHTQDSFLLPVVFFLVQSLYVTVANKVAAHQMEFLTKLVTVFIFRY